jgi:site-specific DNA recombinase
MKIACYTRVSTPQQDEKVQIHFNERKVQELGRTTETVTMFSDHGVSALSVPMSNRPALQELLASVRKDEFDCVIVYNRDRLARNMEEYLEIYDLLKRHNVQLYLSNKYATPVSDDYATEAASALSAEIEGHTIASRTRDVARFYPTAPFGYVKKGAQGDTHYEFSPNGAIALVKQMFTEFEHAKSKNEIALFRTKWRKTLKSRKPEVLLSNSLYAAVLIEQDGTMTPLHHIEPVVDAATIVENRRTLQEAGYSVTPTAKKWPRIRYSDTPIKCAKCRGCLEYRSKSKTWYYYCPQCKKYLVSTERVHGIIGERIKTLLHQINGNLIETRTQGRLYKLMKQWDLEIKRLEDKCSKIQRKIIVHIPADPKIVQMCIGELNKYKAELNVKSEELQKLKRLNRQVNSLKAAIAHGLFQFNDEHASSVANILLYCVLVSENFVRVYNHFGDFRKEDDEYALR